MSLRHLVACVCLTGLFAASAQAAAVGQPVGGADRVQAYGVNTYLIDFHGNELAEVGIVGDGMTDLDVFVYDLNGNLITSGETYSDVEYVSFVPFYTTTFIVEVHNFGGTYNDFGMATN